VDGQGEDLERKKRTESRRDSLWQLGITALKGVPPNSIHPKIKIMQDLLKPRNE